MINSQNSNPFIYLVKPPMKILRTNALVEFVKRALEHLRRKPVQSHWIVLSHKYRPGVLPPIGKVELEFKEITSSDNNEIDELTAIDEWKVPKSVTLRKLKQGHHVYIAKYKGRIVASQTLIMRDRFLDPVLMREFKMASNEAFYLRAFCIPEFRGRGIFRYWRDCLGDAADYDRGNGLAWLGSIIEMSCDLLFLKLRRLKSGVPGLLRFSASGSITFWDAKLSRKQGGDSSYKTWWGFIRFSRG
jgi:hypothetical protein